MPKVEIFFNCLVNFFNDFCTCPNAPFCVALQQIYIALRKYIRLQIIALVVGIGLMALKFLAWWLTNSNAILTDALESIINVVAGSFALYSLYLAAKPKDENHPYGHGKIEFLSAGFEGAMIFLAGITILGKAGYNIFNPQELHQIDLGLLLTLITGSINFLMGKVLEKQGRKANSMTLIASGKHLQSDAYSSLGLLLGLAVLYFTGLTLLDNLVAGIFGLFILITGFRLVRNSVAGIMDEADHLLVDNIVQMLEEKRPDNWIDVHNFRVIKYGATLHIDCHLTLPWYYDTRQSHSEVKAFENLVKAHCKSPVELFIHVDPCEPVSCHLCLKKDCPQRQHPHEQRITWTYTNIMRDLNHSVIC